jgi:hypothetical protein
MTIQAASLLTLGGTTQMSWATELDSTSATPLEKKGIVRWDHHPIWGLRGFIYLREDQSGGAAIGALRSFKDNVTITNVTSGTTTSITTSSLTADIYVDALLRCTDDAGAAGAAPEGETGRIVKNTTTVITIDSNDAFSAAPAANDDFEIIVPWACENSAANDESAQVAGVVMAAQDQYDYGWVQFYGLHPSANIVAAGTAVPVEESLIAGTSLLTDGAGAVLDMRVAFNKSSIASDTVLRKACVFMFCGPIYKLGASTA